MREQTDERFFILFELLRRGTTIEELHDQTGIDLFFLHCFKGMIEQEQEITNSTLETVTKEQLQNGKKKALATVLLQMIGMLMSKTFVKKKGMSNSYRCTKWLILVLHNLKQNSNYFYSSYFGENEQIPSAKRKVAIIGSGPIRIGQGIEFDYCSVHGVFALKQENVETIIN